MKPKQVTVWEAHDGKIYKTAEDCREHEALDASIAEILGTLKDRPEGLRDGDSIEQDPGKAGKACNDFLTLCQHHSDHRWFQQAVENEQLDTCRHGVGRLIDEMHPLLRRAWFRFMCMDQHWREWDQVYNAIQSRDGLLGGTK